MFHPDGVSELSVVDVWQSDGQSCMCKSGTPCNAITKDGSVVHMTSCCVKLSVGGGSSGGGSGGGAGNSYPVTGATHS